PVTCLWRMDKNWVQKRSLRLPVRQFHCGYASCPVLLHSRNRKSPFFAQSGDAPSVSAYSRVPDYNGSVPAGEYHAIHIYVQTIQIHLRRRVLPENLST